MSRSSGMNSSGSNVGHMMCDCGLRPLLLTAYTGANFGRRFIRCPNYNKPSSCGMFIWFDPEMCCHGRRVIGRLLEKHEAVQASLAEYRSYNALAATERDLKNKLEKVTEMYDESAKKEKRMRTTLYMSWTFFFVVLSLKWFLDVSN